MSMSENKQDLNQTCRSLLYRSKYYFFVQYDLMIEDVHHLATPWNKTALGTTQKS